MGVVFSLVKEDDLNDFPEILMCDSLPVEIWAVVLKAKSVKKRDKISGIKGFYGLL